MNNDMYTIEIVMDEEDVSLADAIRSLSSLPKQSIQYEDKDDVLVTEIMKEKKKPEKKKKKKKSKKDADILSGVFDIPETDNDQEIEEETLLDIDNIFRQQMEEEEGDNIIEEQKRNYKKLKKDENDYKKEFAEELTLLYKLLDETSQFGKNLEKDLSSLKGSKVRGVSKYTNDLAELVLSSKQSKLNILKEISAIKKTIADLKIKSESKAKTNETGANSPEYLASAYFKNILSHGRGNFLNAMGVDNQQNDVDDYESMAERIEAMKDRGYEPTDDEEDRYNELIESRLDNVMNPYRSDDGNKYIEYEQRGVKLYVKKCIDTGEWEFVAIDKHNQQIYDYPVPTKRDAGRMRFSDDGTYATDSKGRMYNVIEFYLPEDE